jgi:hypothetical protein
MRTNPVGGPCPGAVVLPPYPRTLLPEAPLPPQAVVVAVNMSPSDAISALAALPTCDEMIDSTRLRHFGDQAAGRTAELMVEPDARRQGQDAGSHAGPRSSGVRAPWRSRQRLALKV